MQCVCESRVDIVVISEPYRQLPFWFNDEGGDASIWVTLFNGKHAASETLIRNVGIVGFRFDSLHFTGPVLHLRRFRSCFQRISVASVIRVTRRNLQRLFFSVYALCVRLNENVASVVTKPRKTEEEYGSKRNSRLQQNAHCPTRFRSMVFQRGHCNEKRIPEAKENDTPK
ncbi:uncharacterized protein LOC117240989 [Bombus vosnesenskii]|uniref:Uncharacterized protein LOC117240989 n=1 Tax=Bombus vosnesenskii TaxID=207650 RepID=A0A6J3LCH4_9HYME|nr:uncharacterized protein LOC117240989 [Bombus vosnesenskii]